MQIEKNQLIKTIKIKKMPQSLRREGKRESEQRRKGNETNMNCEYMQENRTNQNLN